MKLLLAAIVLLFAPLRSRASDGQKDTDQPPAPASDAAPDDSTSTVQDKTDSPKEAGEIANIFKAIRTLREDKDAPDDEYHHCSQLDEYFRAGEVDDLIKEIEEILPDDSDLAVTKRILGKSPFPRWWVRKIDRDHDPVAAHALCSENLEPGNGLRSEGDSGSFYPADATAGLLREILYLAVNQTVNPTLPDPLFLDDDVSHFHDFCDVSAARNDRITSLFKRVRTLREEKDAPNDEYHRCSQIDEYFRVDAVDELMGQIEKVLPVDLGLEVTRRLLQRSPFPGWHVRRIARDQDPIAGHALCSGNYEPGNGLHSEGDHGSFYPAEPAAALLEDALDAARVPSCKPPWAGPF